MWNAAAGVEGTKRGIPSDSSPALTGWSASTSLSGGSAREHAGLRQMRRQRPQDEDPGDVRIDVELGDLADDLAERGVGREPFRTRDDADLAGVASIRCW